MKKLKIWWIVGILVLVAVNFLLFDIAVKRSIDYIEVPVAAKSIKPRSKIDESHIEMRKVPSSLVEGNIFTNKAEIIEQWVKYSVSISSGSFFFHDYLEPADSSKDYPHLMLKEGQGVASLAVDLLISAGNTLLPNQYVDIVFTSKDKRKPIVSDVIFRSVRVLAIKDRNGLAMDDPKSQKVPAVALLAMNQVDIPLFIHAQIFGDIDLIIKVLNDYYPDEAICNTESAVWRLLNE
jgi:Flp pilus assembly protein CpaB